MKDPTKLQRKLEAILMGTPALNIMPPSVGHWTNEELAEVASIVQNFVNQSNEVIEGDPLKDWVEEYKFFAADCR